MGGATNHSGVKTDISALQVQPHYVPISSRPPFASAFPRGSTAELA